MSCRPPRRQQTESTPRTGPGDFGRRGPFEFSRSGAGGTASELLCDVDTVTFRPWRSTDEPFLWDMLFQSLHVRDGAAPFERSILRQPDIAHYLHGFGGVDGDDAQICETADGSAIAAAWCRRLTSDDPGYGHVRDDIPELGMAVEASWRGQGIGRRLLGSLLERNPEMSLSVDDENVGAALLYRSLGFEVVETEGGASTMLRSRPVS